MRVITVRSVWKSTQEIEVPDDAPPIGAGDLDTLLDWAEDDVTPDQAELVDWDIRDPAK